MHPGVQSVNSIKVEHYYQNARMRKHSGVLLFNDLIEEVEEAICGTECTFSAFVIAAVRSALEDLKEE